MGIIFSLVCYQEADLTDNRTPKPNGKSPIGPVPLGQEELRKIFEHDPTPTSMAHPLEIFVPRDDLIALLEASLETMREKRMPYTETDGEKQFVDAAISQRVDLLAQLRATREEEVYVALYLVDLEAEAEIERMILDSEDPDDLFGPFTIS